jgi:hypothetical protein
MGRRRSAPCPKKIQRTNAAAGYANGKTTAGCGYITAGEVFPMPGCKKKWRSP